MEENQKKEEQKRIASECLRNFGLMNQVQEQFMTEDKLYYSERQNQIFDGILYWLSNKPEWLKKVRELEQEKTKPVPSARNSRGIAPCMQDKTASARVVFES